MHVAGWKVKFRHWAEQSFFLTCPYFLAALLPWEQWGAGLRLLSSQGPASGGCLDNGVPHPTPNITDVSWGMDGTRDWSPQGCPNLLSFALKQHLSLWVSVPWKARGQDSPAATDPAKTASPFLSVAVCTAVPIACQELIYCWDSICIACVVYK